MIEALLYLILSGEIQKTSPDFIVPITQSIIPHKSVTKIKAKHLPVLMHDEKTALAAVDFDTQKILISQNFYRPQNIASLTKIMTTLIILQEHQLDEIVTIAPEATDTIGAKIGLLAYEKLTVKTLIEAMLIPSANDAARALAIFNAGSEADFVKKMNKYAQKWGLTSAKFYNASGLDTEDKNGNAVGNTLSAYDILKITRKALRYPVVEQAVKKPMFYGQSIDEKFSHQKPNTNQLLGGFLNLKGVKTGYTKLAGQCLVTLGESPTGNKILTVILGSKDRFGETEKFLSWVYDSFTWQ
ncbi:hypothetical protein CSB37_01620 [bacterium DOLZORAL124_38_8]|nr:MAG: hypothetical protein CSB37_01620 [bacterium DOLZORAL124_38_8]